MDPVTAALASFGGRALSRFGGQQLADKVADLVGMQRQEIKLLRGLSQDVDRLLAEPFHSAARLIEDAGRPWRSDDEATSLLHEARSSLTRALAQDKDALRLSLAALLLAAVWNALGSPEDCREQLSEAYSHAVDAARDVADRDPPPLGPVRSALGLPPWRTRPRSMRISQQCDLLFLGLTVMRLDTYHATRAARKQEAELERLHDYVKWLRGVIVQWPPAQGVLSDHFISVETRYGYEVRVSGAVAITSKIYALKFGSIEPSVSTDDPTERGRLSKERKRLHVQFFPKDGRGPWAGSPREWLERGLVALNWKKGRHN